MTQPSGGSPWSPVPRPRRVWRRRLVHFWWEYQWPIVIALWVGAMVLGYLGFWRYYQIHPGEKPHAIGDLVYYTMQLVPMISGALPHPVPLALEIARHLLPIVEGYAGVVALVVVLSRQLERLRLAGLRDHVIICGLGRKGLLLARRFKTLGLATVIIERAAENPFVGQCRDEGLMVLISDATQDDALVKAGARSARYVIAVCGDDGVNAAVAAAARRLGARRRARPLTCVLHVVDPRVCELLREGELSPESAGGVRLDLFNVYELGAREMLSEHPPTPHGDVAATHPLVVGLGRLGRSVIIQAARDWQPHFRKTGERLRITALGRDAERRVAALQARYPRLADFCEITPCSLDLVAADFQCAPVIFDAQGRCDVTAAYVCVEDETLALATALTLAHDLRGCRVPVVVRVSEHVGLVTLARAAQSRTGTGEGPEAPLYAFALLERTCTPEIVLGGTHETLARAIHEEYIHEEYVRRRSGLGESRETNPALVPWGELPARLQEANRSQADHIGIKLAAAGYELNPLTDWDADLFSFTSQEVERLAELEHERWVDDYAKAGWTYAAGEKNIKARTHPSLVLWSELSEEEKEKDRDVVRLLPVFLARSGFQIRRCAAARG